MKGRKNSQEVVWAKYFNGEWIKERISDGRRRKRRTRELDQREGKS